LKLRRGPYQPVKAIALEQQQKLKYILTHSLSPFYLQKFKEVQGLPNISISSLPLTTSDEFRASPPEDRITQPDIASLIPISTSGSSGKPLTVYMSGREYLLSQLKQLIFFQQLGWKPWWKTIFLWDVDKSSSKSFFQTLVNLKKKVIDISAPLDVQAKMIKSSSPDLLMSTTDALNALAAWSIHNKIAMPRVRLIITCGSPLSPQTRNLLTSTFNAKCADIYGANECGYLGFQCPHCGLYYFNEDSHILEVLDQENRPADHGSLVITALDRRTTPLIRYHIGDMVTLAPREHVCRIQFRHFTSIDGRSTDVLLLPGGGTVTYLSTMKINSIDGLAQFQIVQTGPESYLFRYVKNDSVSESDIIQKVKTLLPEEMLPGLTFQKEKVIHPDKTGKYKVIINQQ